MEACLGSNAIAPSEGESIGRVQFRVSCASALALSKGHTLSENDIVMLRPATGLPPMYKHILIGRRTVRAIGPGEPIRLDDVE